MERIKDFIKAHKYPFIIVVSFLTIAFLWSIFATFSSDTTDSAWDGVVARDFTSGTGTEQNPYIISSAGEFAHLKELLEGPTASTYAGKIYSIVKGFNYGNYDISINNSVPFSGTINGNGNIIYNATITNGLFNTIANAVIKNINLNDISYTLNSTTGALLANGITETNVDMFVFSGNVSINNNAYFGGMVYTSSNSMYSNIILNYDVTGGTNVNTFANTLDGDNGNNILIKSSNYAATSSETDIVFNSFSSVNNIDNLERYSNNDYKVSVTNNKLLIESKSNGSNSKGPLRAVSGNSTITEHASGVDGTTVYINDLTADRNYLTGLNFAEVRNTSIPSGISTGYYDANYLVKVEIIYDGADINNSSLVGAVSPINNENTNKYVYFKYYPLQRNSSGTLATNSDGDNYIRIELIDNPFSKRPYVSGTEYGFNGWVCNQNVDTTTDLCENSVMRFNKDDYTRYMDIAVNGGSEIIVHLNANWYKANVVTSYNDITNFNTMSMQPTNYTVPVQVTEPASYFWKQNYTQMVYERTVTRNNTLPRYYWYKTSLTGTSYTYVSRRNTSCNYTNCYVYSANQTAIPSGSKYNGESVTFVPNFRNNNSNTEVTITTYDTTYMNLLADPDGEYTLTSTIQSQRTYIPGNNASAYFYRVNNPTSQMIATGKYYNSSGGLCTSTSGCSTAYKLIQYNDDTLKSNGNTISLMETTADGSVVDADKYYYLVTRDMNIFRYTSTTSLGLDDIEVNRPFTITGTSVNGTTVTGVLEYPYTTSWFTGRITYSDFAVQNDLVIENIKIDGPDTTGTDNAQLGANSKTSQVIYARGNNLKIGRNVTSSDGSGYLTGEAIFGGTNSSSGSGTYRVIIESGNYYAYHSGAMSGSDDYTFNETTIFGNDYDRVKNSNDKLKFLIGLDGYAGGDNTAGSDSLFASYNIVKSGKFGYNSDDTPNTDNTAGLYIGARSSTYMNSLTGAKIEGGIINTIVGGYGYNGSATTNSTFIGMSGGTVRSIYGGAGHSTTKGNRIICVTGGTVSYSILGGSDSFESGDTNDGIVQGATLVYVGGNVTVGGGTGELYGVEAGSVFGAGGGDTSSTQKGTVYNSHVIINGGTINTSVYGGGNHGSTGTQNNAASSTVIDVYAGTIGSVYGGSRSADFGKSDYENSSTIDINVIGGTIGNIYGGSNTEGNIYGTVDIDITGGTINSNVYGGGRGSSTTTTNNVDVTIGDTNNGPTVRGNVYGGSAFGSVNATNKGNVAVTVNKGTVVGGVFGGGQGSATETPVVNGNINVTINGGDITSVFGGNDQAGSHGKLNEVHLNGGDIDEVYGGGNKSSVTTTHVYLTGANVTNIYGGSNTSGNVTTSNVAISSGTVTNVFGGNDEGGTCGTTNVTVQGTAQINGAVYGGGNEVNTTTTNVTLTSAGATIPAVYGGGNSANVTTSNVTQNGTTVTNMFGGSNSSGTVTNSYVTHTNGTTTNVYGGNNAGGNTLTSHVNINGGTVTTVYGGGNQANGGTSNVNLTGGTVTTVYGGGNNAGLDESHVTVNGSTVTDVYGGSNNTGTVDETNVLITSTTGTVNSVYGGGNRAQVGDTSVNVTGGTISSVFGGGNLAQVTGDTNVVVDSGTIGAVYGGGNLAQVTGDTTVDINGGTISGNLYGGGNQGVVKGSSNVTVTDATILGSAYAGGNGSTAILEGNTNITIDGNTVIGSTSSTPPTSGCVFGGGNQAATGTQSANNSTSNVNIVGGTIYGNVYGGANTSVIYGNTVVNIGKTAYTSQSLSKTDIHVKGHIFGGGEANASGSEIYDWSFISVTEGVNITVDADTYNNFNIDGSFFGGGNASTASGDSYLLIRNYGSGVNPKHNVSIQRVTYATIDNSSILLAGAIDRANEYSDELFAISRVDELKLQNNSYLFLSRGANLLKDFKSLDDEGNPAAVEIDTENHDITSITVDNRVYLYEGRQLNIAKDQQSTDCGNVTGMTFFGIFNFANGDVNTGMYNPSYESGDTLNNSLLFSKGSVIKGKHMPNHDITVNGFYSNFMNSETKLNEIDYVDPTPKDAQHYMWHIGENVVEYNVNLTASKYSTLGSIEFPFEELYKPNTSFQIDGFDISDIATGVTLVDKNNIPRIASTPESANNVFGLAMEASNSGWLTTGKTSFYTSSPFMSGVTYYEGENSTVVPTMLFYLYHSKNLTETRSLGTVKISISAITQISAIANEITRLVVNVNMSSAFFQEDIYEAAMTPGDKYDLFTSTATNITTKSKFSAFFSLYAANKNLYSTGYHRALTSSYVLPVGTKITMLDFSLGTPEYYYHVITAADVAAANTEFSTEGECSYNLSLFTKMGSLNSNTNYNDALKNALYYNGTDSSEEFIFIVDFSDTSISENHMGNSLLLEMRDGSDESKIGVLGIQHDQLVYNLYYGNDSAIDMNVTPSDNPLYIGHDDIFDVVINYQGSSTGGVNITDTQYFDSKLGVQIYITDNLGNLLSGTDLTGAYFIMDGVRYYPDIAGYTHIKLVDKVGNAEKWIVFNTDNANLITGSYRFHFEAFASPDGIYYSSGTPDYLYKDINIINSKYGLNPIIDDDSVIFSANNDKPFKFTVNYESMLTAPNIRISLYRRRYDTIYDTRYTQVDFQDFTSAQLTVGSNLYEYIIDNNPISQRSYNIPFASELVTGTYRVVFRLYDGDTLIGDMYRYIIVR